MPCVKPSISEAQSVYIHGGHENGNNNTSIIKQITWLDDRKTTVVIEQA